jgi:hypothetical protein
MRLKGFRSISVAASGKDNAAHFRDMLCCSLILRNFSASLYGISLAAAAPAGCSWVVISHHVIIMKCDIFTSLHML